MLDTSMNDIKYVVNPVYTPELISTIDTEMRYSRGLDGTEYIPGVVGLNNIKTTDYLNAAVQALARISPLRDHFLALDSGSDAQGNQIVRRFGELIRKMFNPRNFKVLVCVCCTDK